MRVAGVQGLRRRKRRGCTRRSEDAEPSADLVKRDFDPEEPDRLWMMGSIGDCVDISAVESFPGTMQLDLLDEHHRETQDELATAIFEWIEAWYNPRRCHSYCDMLSPADYEAAQAP